MIFHTPRRGFTMIVVALIVVIITAMVAGVLSAVRSENVSGIRAREEARARAIAEGCADRMFAAATTYIKDVEAASNEPPPDFDGLLDPDSIAGNDDDFIPGGGGVAFVPRASTSPAHRYGVFRIDGGACFIRLDDNSDDWHPGLGVKSTTTVGGVVEGPLAKTEVTIRDRDRSIWVSVIGLFPAQTATPDAELWERAHARVPIRRFLETAGGPAIWAGDEVTMAASGVAVCGLGGIVSAEIERPSDVCACGHQKHDDIDGAIDNECDYGFGAGDFCDDVTRACEPNLRFEARQPDPDDLPDPITFREISQPNEFHDGRCGVWLRDVDALDPGLPVPDSLPARPTYKDTTPGLTTTDGLAYLWVGDTIRSERSSPLARILAGGICGSTLGSNRESCPGGVAEACPDSPPAGRAVRPPCRWTDASGNIVLTPSCNTFNTATTDDDESRCWIPIAKLDGQKTLMIPEVTGALKPLDDTLDAAGLPLAPDALDELARNLVSTAVGVGEMTVLTNGAGTGPCSAGDCVERIAFQRLRPAIELEPLPGTKVKITATSIVVTVGPLSVSASLGGGLGQRLMELLGPNPAHGIQSICGGGCVGDDDCVDDPSFFIDKSDGRSSFTTDKAFADKRLLPQAMTFLVENEGRDPNGRERLRIAIDRPTTDVALKTPLQVAFRASGDLEMVKPATLCCPTCTCPTAAQLPSRRNPNEAPRDPGLDCDVHAATSWVPPGGVRNLITADTGCRLHGDSVLLGAIRCGNVSVTPGIAVAGDDAREAGGCFIGGIDGRPLCTGAACPARGDDHLIDDCTGRSGDDDTIDDGDFRVPDCSDEGVCIAGKTGIVGNLRSATDICLGPDVTVFGQVVALDDVAITRDVVVNHDNAGSIGAVTQAQAWVEGP